MKRILVLCLGLALGSSLYAQSEIEATPDFEEMSVRQYRRYKFDQYWKEMPKFEARIGYGGLPLFDMLGYGFSYLEDVRPFWYRQTDLEGLYAPQNGTSYMTGTFTGEFSWNIKKWFSLAGQACMNVFWGSKVDPSSGAVLSNKTGISFSIVPFARFYWANYRACRLYSAIGLGANVSSFRGETHLLPELQFTPLGITAGRRVFFFAEYSYGTLYLGGQLGVGYRF